MVVEHVEDKIPCNVCKYSFSLIFFFYITNQSIKFMKLVKSDSKTNPFSNLWSNSRINQPLTYCSSEFMIKQVDWAYILILGPVRILVG